MERTNIFAHSHKLIPYSHSDIACPNCTHYLTEIDVLKSKLQNLVKEVGDARPFIKKIAQNQDIINYEEQLRALRKSYEGLEKMLSNLDDQNQQLMVQNEKTKKQNRILKNDIAKYCNQIQNFKNKLERTSVKSEKQNKNDQTQSSVLYEISSRKANRFDQRQKQRSHDSEQMEQFMKENRRIQALRHEKINYLEKLLDIF